MAGNSSKYLSYKEAWRRIDSSMESGTYFEAVTLCESIIADRLLSYVLGCDPTSKVNIHTNFSNLIAAWRKLAGKLPAISGVDLGAAVDSWRKERNTIVHGLTKSMPGTPTDTLEPFMARAESAARDGAILARALSNWHRKQLAAHRAN